MALTAGAGADHDVVADGAQEVVIDREQEVARLHRCLERGMQAAGVAGRRTRGEIVGAGGDSDFDDGHRPIAKSHKASMIATKGATTTISSSTISTTTCTGKSLLLVPVVTTVTEIS
eukprot:2329774-Rhodomonas_salina.1